MPRLRPRQLHLAEAQRTQLTQLVNKHATPQQIALRARIILLADAGLNHRQIAGELKLSLDMARTWRQRWLDWTGPDEAVLERLQDTERPGAPPTFTPEQLTHLFAIACEDPAQSARPISHWTARELADEMRRRGIVSSISPRHVGRLLEEADLKPHQSRYWLRPPADDPQLEEKVQDICQVYPEAPERAQQGERTLSTDELSGIQVLERTTPNLPLAAGKVERREFEYVRHGTQTLMANLDVASGQIVAPSCGDTRTEQDFAQHIQRTLATDPTAS